MITLANGVSVLCDSSKGSMTNRVACAKETLKNDMKFGMQVAVPTAAVTVAALTKPGILTKAASYVGKGLATLIGKLGSKVATSKIAQKIIANPTKAGAAGLVTAGALYLLNRIAKYNYTSGQIDQKYTDAAAIESQTKNIVLA